MINKINLKIGETINIDDTGNFKGKLSGMTGVVIGIDKDGSYVLDYKHGQYNIDSVEEINGIKQYYWKEDRR